VKGVSVGIFLLQTMCWWLGRVRRAGDLHSSLLVVGVCCDICSKGCFPPLAVAQLFFWAFTLLTCTAAAAAAYWQSAPEQACDG
jgi:hypothetical protein